jgi:hypothetical protein
MLLSRSARFLTLLLAAMQFAAPAVVSVVDGAFAKSVRDPVMHVEANGDNECTPPHTADCTVCRYLSGNGAGVPERVAELIAIAGSSFVPDVALSAGTIVSGQQRSRAPPTV